MFEQMNTVSCEETLGVSTHLFKSNDLRIVLGIYIPIERNKSTYLQIRLSMEKEQPELFMYGREGRSQSATHNIRYSTFLCSSSYQQSLPLLFSPTSLQYTKSRLSVALSTVTPSSAACVLCLVWHVHSFESRSITYTYYPTPYRFETLSPPLQTKSRSCVASSSKQVHELDRISLQDS